MSTSLSPEIEAFESQMLTLAPHERAHLASRLIASLDELNPEDTEALWVREARHRYEAYRKGG
ncbi:MAG: addiction module protein [Opitutales bacterium]